MGERVRGGRDGYLSRGNCGRKGSESGGYDSYQEEVMDEWFQAMGYSTGGHHLPALLSEGRKKRERERALVFIRVCGLFCVAELFYHFVQTERY